MNSMVSAPRDPGKDKVEGKAELGAAEGETPGKQKQTESANIGHTSHRLIK